MHDKAKSMSKYAIGLRGQEAAEAFLLEKGYAILVRNYRVKSGEIDLIAQHGQYIIFVEVKLRSSAVFGLPRESVGYSKQQKIIKTAMHYIAKNKLHDQDFRFDVIEVIEISEGTQKINHIENAFGV